MSVEISGSDNGIASEKNQLSEAREPPEIDVCVEPASQGGATFYRCKCGREAMRRRDLQSKNHYRECSAIDG